jgi:hypothetical protein
MREWHRPLRHHWELSEAGFFFTGTSLNIQVSSPENVAMLKFGTSSEMF